MAYDYCCFVSYPRGQNNEMVPLVEDFVAGLEKEIKLQIRKDVWIDYKFLKGGTRLDQEIGPTLCKSVCMLLIYTPLYFDTEHTYCARELTAMQQLEEKRLRLLRDKGKGLIIPVIIRGEKRFPKALSENRLYYNFTDIAANNPRKKLRTKYADQIKEIAEYIIERCEQLEQAAGTDAHDCEKFSLPSSEEAKMYIESVLGKTITDVPVPFVVRTE